MTKPKAGFDRSSARPTWRRWSRRFASCFSFLALTGALALAQQLPASKGLNFYSIEKEIAAGAMGAERMAQSTTSLRDALVTQYLNAVGQQLAGASGAAGFPYSFAVFRGGAPLSLLAFPVDAGSQDLQEAIALAGGPVFVPAQLAEQLDGEPELAAVLAHAIAHVALRHASRIATRAELTKRAAQGMPPDLANANSSLVSYGLASQARRFENDADLLAVHILGQAGYDPAGLVSYLRKLPAQFGVLAAQPDPAVRIQAAQSAIRLLPAKTYRTDAGRFAEWKTAVISTRTP